MSVAFARVLDYLYIAMLEIYVGLMSSCGFSLGKCGKIGKMYSPGS